MWSFFLHIQKLAEFKARVDTLDDTLLEQTPYKTEAMSGIVTTAGTYSHYSYGMIYVLTKFAPCKTRY